MENITLEIKNFLESTGIKQFELAEAAGVSTATISRLVTGKQKDILFQKANSLRAAMTRLTTSTPAPPAVPVAAGAELHASQRLPVSGSLSATPCATTVA